MYIGELVAGVATQDNFFVRRFRSTNMMFLYLYNMPSRTTRGIIPVKVSDSVSCSWKLEWKWTYVECDSRCRYMGEWVLIMFV